MTYPRILALTLCVPALISFANAGQMQDRLEGLGAAWAVMVPYDFQNQCIAESKDQISTMHCTLRTDAVKRGANFYQTRRNIQIKLGYVSANGKPTKIPYQEQVVDYVLTKRFAEKAFDDCMLRQAGGGDENSALHVTTAICGLERADLYEGMRRFQEAVEQAP